MANILNVESDDQTVERLLEIAAKNDVQGLLHCIQHNPACVDGVGVWFGQPRGSRNWSITSQRTPLMVAAACGNFSILKQILSWSKADVNRSCGSERVTALHCAAMCGSTNAVMVVKLLLDAGADPNLADAHGLHPRDVIVEVPRFPWLKDTLERMLSPEKKQGLISISPGSYYTTDFMMYSFKVKECFIQKQHEWESCPLYHPGRGDQRRDPSVYDYKSYPCKSFKVFCDKGVGCRFSHGDLESGLHPNQYRTHLCPNGAKCTRKVCFSAHTKEQLRSPTNMLPNSSPLSTSSLSRDIRAMNLSNANIKVHQQQQQFLNEPSISTETDHESSSAVWNQYQTESSQTVDRSLLLCRRIAQALMIARREEHHQWVRSLQFASNDLADHAASSEETAYSNSSEEGESSSF